MNIQRETAALMVAPIRNGGEGISKAVTGQRYSLTPESATSEYAAAKVAARFRLTISTAREVCRMAGLAVRP